MSAARCFGFYGNLGAAGIKAGSRHTPTTDSTWPGRSRLPYSEEAVGPNVLDPRDPVSGTGPDYLNGPDHRGCPQAEMQRRRRLRQIGGAEMDLLHLPARSRNHCDARSDRMRVRMPALEIDRQPAIAGLEHIAIDRRRGIVVGDQDVDPAVAVIVGADHAPALARVADAQLGRALGEDAVAVRHEQPGGVFEESGIFPGGFLRQVVLSGLGHAVAVGVEDVDMPVIVEIGETGAPAPAARPDAGRIGHVLEPAVAAVPVKPVAGGAFSGQALGSWMLVTNQSISPSRS